MPNGALYKKYGDKILLTVKTRNSVRYDFKKEPRFLILSYMKKEPLFRTIFLYKNPNYTQQDLIGISEKKYSILVFRENV